MKKLARSAHSWPVAQRVLLLISPSVYMLFILPRGYPLVHCIF